MASQSPLRRPWGRLARGFMRACLYSLPSFPHHCLQPAVAPASFGKSNPSSEALLPFLPSCLRLEKAGMFVGAARRAGVLLCQHLQRSWGAMEDYRQGGGGCVCVCVRCVGQKWQTDVGGWGGDHT